MSSVLSLFFPPFPKLECRHRKSFFCSLYFQGQTSTLSVVWEHLKGRGLGDVYGRHKANRWDLQWEGSLQLVHRLQDDYNSTCMSASVYVCWTYSQLVLLLPLAVSWEMCFWSELRKQFQPHYQINPFIADNCLSCKDLPWTCRGRKVQNSVFSYGNRGQFSVCRTHSMMAKWPEIFCGSGEGMKIGRNPAWWGWSLTIL